jgi:prepilin-type N-terminal cleavage/methylation domain-containing protein
MKNKRGFTLVELLAVVVILAILVIIALPNVLKMFVEAKKSTFVTEVQNIYNETAKKYISESMNGEKISTISSKDSSKLDMTGEELDYCIILDSQGKVEKLAVGNNSYYIMLNDVESINSITKENVQEGKLSDMKCDASAFKVKLDCKFDGKMEYGAEYVNGQYTYRYMQGGSYASSGLTWGNINIDGWGVQLTDKTSTGDVETNLCTTINGKPIVSMSYMFSGSQATKLNLSSFDTSNVTNMRDMFGSSKATSLDLSNFNTSNVTNMGSMFLNSYATEIKGLEKFNTSKVTNMQEMFYSSNATSLDLGSFDTSNVTNMSGMFQNSQATTLDLSNFDTSNVKNMRGMFFGSNAITLNLSNFNTSNVTNMQLMFSGSKAKVLDLSSFDTSSVTNMNNMFQNASATTGYARNDEEATKFNATSGKPSGLTFVVKGA